MIEIYDLNLVERGSGVFVADTARITGNVVLEDDVSIWYGAVLRGDLDYIRIGKGSNVQDNCVVHVCRNLPVTMGHYVTIGHGSVIHAAEIGDFSLIGMHACILDGAIIGKNCIIGAGSLIPPRSRIPDASLVMGVPGKVIKEITPAMMQSNRQNAEDYIMLAQKYLKQTH